MISRRPDGRARQSSWRSQWHCIFVHPERWIRRLLSKRCRWGSFQGNWSILHSRLVYSPVAFSEVLFIFFPIVPVGWLRLPPPLWDIGRWCSTAQLYNFDRDLPILKPYPLRNCSNGADAQPGGFCCQTQLNKQLKKKEPSHCLIFPMFKAKIFTLDLVDSDIWRQ